MNRQYIIKELNSGWFYEAPSRITDYEHSWGALSDAFYYDSKELALEGFRTSWGGRGSAKDDFLKKFRNNPSPVFQVIEVYR